MEKVLEQLEKLRAEGLIDDFVLMWSDDSYELNFESEAGTAFLALAAREMESVAARAVEDGREE